ncbi:MAG: Flagellar hook-associated protein 1, partial [Campylobacterota bacterium]|nr:Flagellar hook-associated protein 1 [Campylobacterota bacterium]
INYQITQVETTDYVHANKLRDERDQLEIALSTLISPTINKMGTKSFIEVDMSHADYSETYSVELGGYPLVDGNSFHPLVIDASDGTTGNLRSVFFKSQDHTLKNITANVKEGKIGAILDLRGRNFNYDLSQPADGKIQNYIDGLDVLSRSLIQQTNNIYAKSADTYMFSDQVGKSISLTSTETGSVLSNLMDKKYDKKVQAGEMVISTYDLSGKIIQGDIKVALDPTTSSLKDIVDQINAEFANQNINAKAEIELGSLVLKPDGGTGSEKVSAVLIKEDNTLITEALNITGSKPLSTVDAIDIPFEITNGTFDIGIFDEQGNQKSTRTIKIDKDSGDPLYSSLNGIAAQINMKYIDDDGDNDFSNDVDDTIEAVFSNNRFTITTKNKDVGSYFNIVDDGTGFAGALGLHKFLEGDSAKNISLNTNYEENPALMNAYSNPVDGNNVVANDIQQLQYNKIPFFNVDGTVTYETIASGYRYYAGKLAEDTNGSKLQMDTHSAVYTSIKSQQDAISRVSVDEELTNLLKYQTGYGANAKVITTIQQMLDTLLTLKQ